MKQIHPTNKDYYASRALVMKALGHPSRLMMVDALSEGAMCVCDLRDLVGHDMSTVSKHLTMLKNVGLVEDEKRGKHVYYKLRVPCVLNFFQCIESVLEGHTK